MSRIDQLLDFIFSPAAVLLIFGGVVWIGGAIRYNELRWMLFGLTMYIASVAKFFDSYTEKFGPPLNWPFEFIAMNNRPIALLLLSALFLLCFLSSSKTTAKFLPSKMMLPIHAIQAMIFLKVFESGKSDDYAIQAGLIFLAIGIVAALGLRQWAYGTNSVYFFTIAVCSSSFLFAIATEWHLFTNPSAIHIGSRLMGTTANPQHAAVFLSLSLPAVIYLLTSKTSIPRWMQLTFLLPLLIMNLHLLLLTGSRTGLLMAIVAITIQCCFLFKGAFLTIALIASIALAVLPQLIGNESLERYVSMEDTRTLVWRAQWEVFLANPVFGAPHEGAQFRAAENSWLAVMASFGIVGIACLIWLLVAFLGTAKELWKRRHNFGYREDAGFMLASIFTLFAGSFFEAYLLGVITFPVLFIAGLAVVCEKSLEQSKSPARNFTTHHKCFVTEDRRMGKLR
jgi:hypothetical protein